jgi:hypothetical protein
VGEYTKHHSPGGGLGSNFACGGVRILDSGRGAAEWDSVCGVPTSEKHSSMKAVTGQTWRVACERSSRR